MDEIRNAVHEVLKLPLMPWRKDVIAAVETEVGRKLSDAEIEFALSMYATWMK